MAIASSMRRAAPASSALASQRSQAVRMNLFVLVRILFQYLERVDRSILDLAKEVLKDCERKHNTKDSKYETLADAISERVRDAVGENHWTKAREIQKQLARNQQKKKVRAMQVQKQRHVLKKQQQTRKVSQDRLHLYEGQASEKDETMDVAMTLSGLSQQQQTLPAPSPYSEETENYPTRTPEPRKSSLTINEEPPPSILRGGDGPSHPHAAGASSATAAGGQLPLRKRIMFASPPVSTAPSFSTTNSDSSQQQQGDNNGPSFSFTQMRR